MHGVHAAFALNGFEKHGNYVGVAFGSALQGGNIVAWHADKALNQRAKTSLYFRVGGGA